MLVDRNYSSLDDLPAHVTVPFDYAWVVQEEEWIVQVDDLADQQGAAHVRLRYMSVVGEWVARDLRSELYEHLQTLSLSFFSRKKTGSLITRVTADTDRLWEFIAFGVVDVSLSLVMLIGLGAVLLTLDWRLGLVMTLPVPVFCWLIYWHGESLNGLFIRGWRKWSRVTDVLSDTIPGIRVVKAFNQETRVDAMSNVRVGVVDQWVPIGQGEWHFRGPVFIGDTIRTRVTQTDPDLRR